MQWQIEGCAFPAGCAEFRTLSPIPQRYWSLRYTALAKVNTTVHLQSVNPRPYLVRQSPPLPYPYPSSHEKRQWMEGYTGCCEAVDVGLYWTLQNDCQYHQACPGRSVSSQCKAWEIQLDACLLHETTCAVACLRNQEGSGRGHMLLMQIHVLGVPQKMDTIGHDRSKVMKRFGGILCNNPCLIVVFFFIFILILFLFPFTLTSLINSLRTNNFTAIDCEYKKARKHTGHQMP